MATTSALTIDSREFDAATKRFVAGIKRLPKTKKSPLVRTAQRYREFLRKALTSRPTIAQSGTWLGQQWEKLEPAYTRVTDGVVVPVWGGVKRAVMQGGFGAQGAHSRLGVVTRAGNASIRRGSGLSQAEKDAGFYVVQKGQRFSAANVKGKLRTDGTRYRGEDPQLGRRSDGLLQDWISAPPVESNRGKTVTKTSNKRYSGKVAEKRNFHWPPKARRDLTPRLVRRIKKYVVDLWKGLV